MKLLQRYYAFPVTSRAMSVGDGLRVGGASSVTRTTEIGENVTLEGLHIYGCGKVKIGSHTKIGQETVILSQNHNYEGNKLPYGSDYVAKDVTIGECVWIGMRVTILPGTEIGEGAIVQAGSVVHGKIPPFAIVGGNPAKVFAWRDKEHYVALRSQGSYMRW
jgi:acetyltransferase-like isoleucine patch superfamily enzyme